MPQDNYKNHLYALLIAGGGGTRLWPRSRNEQPKQFLQLFGENTLTQITAQRFNKIIPWEKIFCVTTTNEYKKEILRELPKFKSENIIVEPVRRNTAPAHALGALYIHAKDPDAVILNESADHLVNPVQSYLKSEKVAAQAAYRGDWLVSVGIKPTYPNIGYGYIKKGVKVMTIDSKSIFKLEKFEEKPELKTAQRYVRSGNYYWNANQYVWRASTFLDAIAKYAPDIYKGLEKIKESMGTKYEIKTIREEYEKMPDISVDYAIAEKAPNFLLVTADYYWTDIGDWKEVWENLGKDQSGNVVIEGTKGKPDIINIDTSDALIHTNGKLVAVIDVDNIVIIDTEDALLVCSKSRAQNVKKIVEELKRQGRKALL